jgi:hypothetical protein
MFQWTEKFQAHNDWVTLFIILVFILSVYLYRKNPHQFKLLISFWNSKSYFNIYYKEKFANPKNKFNLILTFITLITFSLLSYFFYKKILVSLLGEISIFTFFVSISLVVIIRYEILKLIFELSDQLELYQLTIFKSISFYGMISLYTLFLFSIYHYQFPNNKELFFLITILIICAVNLSHLIVYLRIIRINLQNIVYLILYLCAFKLAPWLWLYKSIYWTKAK